MNTTYLRLSWSTSRGAETYGYNIVSLLDERTGKRYRAMGGGYDMTGTAFGQWLQDAHQDALQAWAHHLPTAREGGRPAGRIILPSHYGAFVRPGGSVYLDGGCGLSSMERVAESIGVKLERTYVRTGRNRGTTTGWLATDPE